MGIKAVIFDMGGTIETLAYTQELRLAAIPGLKERLVSAKIDLNLSDNQTLEMITSGLHRYHKWRMQTLQEIPAVQIWCSYILADYTGESKLLDAGLAEELMTYYEKYFYKRVMRPEIPAVLEKIQQMGLKIGLISNVSSRGQVPTNLEEYGIRHYFDPIVLSSEYGRRKPDPSIFYYAARLANVPTSQCLYVGDRVARDVLGARRAGYRLTVQIRHEFDHGEDDSGPAPHHIINRMDELIGILEEQKKYLSGVPDRKIQALLFDAGDVLYYRPDKKKKLEEFLGELGLCPPCETFDGKKDLVDQAYQGEISQDEYREALLRGYGVTKSDDIARGKQILEEEGNNVKFFNGVCDTLRALKERGYLLGIVTDTAAPFHIKLSWLEKGGFGDVWDSVVSSQELGIRKPSPEIYQAALCQLNISPQHTIFVGHKVSELDGANALGLHTVAFNPDPGARADIFIGQFSEILNLPLLFEPNHQDQV